jgi:hypothetical protein
VGKWGVRKDTTLLTIKIQKIGNKYQVSTRQAEGISGYLCECENGTIKANDIEISHSEIGDYIMVSGVELSRK